MLLGLSASKPPMVPWNGCLSKAPTRTVTSGYILQCASAPLPEAAVLQRTLSLPVHDGLIMGFGAILLLSKHLRDPFPSEEGTSYSLEDSNTGQISNETQLSEQRPLRAMLPQTDQKSLQSTPLVLLSVNGCMVLEKTPDLLLLHLVKNVVWFLAL